MSRLVFVCWFDVWRRYRPIRLASLNHGNAAQNPMRAMIADQIEQTRYCERCVAYSRIHIHVAHVNAIMKCAQIDMFNS